jgi:hypothetical protein
MDADHPPKEREMESSIMEAIRSGHCPALKGCFDLESIEIVDGEMIDIGGELELWPEEASCLDLIMPIDPPSYIQLWSHPSGSFKARIDGDSRYCFISREEAERLIGWRNVIQDVE